MGGKKTTPGLISFISEMEDIRALEYDYERFRKSSDFPTIFYIVEEQKGMLVCKLHHAYSHSI